MKSQKTLIILETQNLSDHIKDRLKLNEKFKNIKIHCWNILPILNYKIFKSEPLSKIKISKKNKYINIISTRDLFKKILKLENSFFYINNCKYCFLTFLIESIFRYKKGKKILLLPGSHDLQNEYKKKFFEILIKNPFFLIKKVFNFVLKYIYNIFLIFIHQKPNLIFVGNNYEFDIIKKIYPKQKIYKFNSPEFEKYLSLKHKKIKNKKKIVYIDQKFHGLDLKINYQTKINNKEEKKFYTKVNLFLDQIKTTYKSHEILIAAHPRQKKNFGFFKKKVYFQKTFDLIRNSKFIVCHNSLAIKYAVLLKKPIIMLQDKEFFHSEVISEQNFFKKNLGIQCFDLNRKIKKKKIVIKVNQSKYKNFSKKFINFDKLKDYGRFNKIASVINSIN